MDPAAVEQHADQFGQDVPVRRPGSQQELAAATYLLGHLERAGYAVRLDAVPVADLVRSTNVVTVPPEDDTPGVLVAVIYDTGPSGSDETDLGIFLELARASAVSGGGSPKARFAALGAEHSSESGGHLGSRRLAQVLLEGKDEMALSILIAGGGDSLMLGGSYQKSAADLAEAGGWASSVFSGDPFAQETSDILGRVVDADLIVAGPPEVVGPFLLELIDEHAG